MADSLQRHGWGCGTRGQLSRQDDEGREQRPLAGLPELGMPCDARVIHIACGTDFTMLVTMHGDVWACGANERCRCAGCRMGLCGRGGSGGARAASEWASREERQQRSTQRRVCRAERARAPACRRCA